MECLLSSSWFILSSILRWFDFIISDLQESLWPRQTTVFLWLLLKFPPISTGLVYVGEAKSSGNVKDSWRPSRDTHVCQAALRYFQVRTCVLLFPPCSLSSSSSCRDFLSLFTLCGSYFCKILRYILFFPILQTR